MHVHIHILIMLICNVHLHPQQLFLFTVHTLIVSFLMFSFLIRKFSCAEVNPDVYPTLLQQLHRCCKTF